MIDDSGHLVEHINQPAIRMIEVFAEAVNGDDYPVGVATVAEFDRLVRVIPNSLL